MQNAFEDARVATWNQYAQIWNDATKMKLALSCKLMTGTGCILTGESDAARSNAAIASYFEQWVKIKFHKTQPTMNWGKVIELFHSDEHTLVSFFRHRVHCKCLDKKHKEVKYITKMGICWNLTCSLPDNKADRSKMQSS
jgi:hypothetical protein